MGARFVIALSFVIACDALPPAQDGVCGNKVIDPSEDCDTFASAPGAVCRPPGTTGQCRYTCGLQPDGTTATCPPTMGCGTDGTCRTASGSFVETTQLIDGAFSDVYVGDVDGDRRADVVGLEPGVISTSFFDSTLQRATVDTARRANESLHPLLRDISGDGRADLVVGSGNGTLVELGRTSRAFAPLAFPSTYLPGLTNARLILLEAPPPNRGETFFIMGTYGSVSGIAVLQASGQGAPFTVFTSPPDLAGPIVVGHMIEDPSLSPCGDIAFGMVGSTEIDVYTACSPDGKGNFAFNDYTVNPPTAVKLPSGAALVSGPMLTDANGDGHLDFLVGASRCSGCDEVDVALGAGDGTFTAFAPYGPMPNNKQGPLPLAMGDLDGDGILDQVTTTQVLVSKKNGNAVDFIASAVTHGAPWTQAAIGDFNRDGIPDVAAGSSAAPNVNFYLGVGNGTLDAFVIPSAPTRHFIVGDFDGDLVGDLALAEVGAADDPLGDSVSLIFGNTSGAPTAPVSMGRFVGLSQTTSGRFVDLFGILGGTDTLITLAESQSATWFGTFAGSGDRVLRSPFTMNILKAAGTAAAGYPLRYTFGHFVTATPFQLAALDDQYFPITATPIHHTWLMPFDGEGRFDMKTSRASDDVVPDGIDWRQAALVAVDLDGSGTDQLVAFGPSPADKTQGMFAVARLVPGTSEPALRFAFGSPAPAPVVVTRIESDDVGAQSGRVMATDVDGDGKPDLVAVATIAGTPTVVVLWNDLGGTLGAMTPIHNPNGHAALDFTLVDAGAGAPSLAVLTDEGVTLVPFTQRTPAAATALAAHATGGYRVAAGDIDGDGVEDLAVATSAGIAIFRGRAVRP